MRADGKAVKWLVPLFWLGVWQLCAILVGREVFLAPPLSVAKALAVLIGQPAFWRTVAFSVGRIGGGFLLAVAVGTALSALSARFAVLRALLSPLMGAVRATPVASFIILVLLWVPSRGLSVVISFLMVMPIVYQNLLEGILSVDGALLEMAKVYRMSAGRQFLYIYLPALLPYFSAACATGLGLCWKSGVAAEVIGLPDGSIGERLYQAKLYLATADLLAWTAVIIALSALAERGVTALLRVLTARVARGDSVGGAALWRGSAGSPAPVPGEVYVNNVTAGYGDTAVLKNFSARFIPGEPVGVTGPSGVGKTTLLRLLLGLAKPVSGEIAGAGDMAFSAVFQEDRLCGHLSALMNCAIVQRAPRRTAIVGALADLGLTEEQAARPVDELSGGQRRRVALARAMEADSAAVVLDEPFTGLDDAARTAAAAYVNRRLSRRLLVFVSHDREDLALLMAKELALAPPVGAEGTAAGE